MSKSWFRFRAATDVSGTIRRYLRQRPEELARKSTYLYGDDAVRLDDQSSWGPRRLVLSGVMTLDIDDVRPWNRRPDILFDVAWHTATGLLRWTLTSVYDQQAERPGLEGMVLVRPDIHVRQLSLPPKPSVRDL